MSLQDYPIFICLNFGKLPGKSQRKEREQYDVYSGNEKYDSRNKGKECAGSGGNPLHNCKS